MGSELCRGELAKNCDINLGLIIVKIAKQLEEFVFKQKQLIEAKVDLMVLICNSPC